MQARKALARTTALASHDQCGPDSARRTDWKTGAKNLKEIVHRLCLLHQVEPQTDAYTRVDCDGTHWIRQRLAHVAVAHGGSAGDTDHGDTQA